MPQPSLSDTELILAVVALFYLSECACWLPRAVAMFISRRRGYRSGRGPGFLQNDRGGLTFASLWPGGSALLVPFPEGSSRIRRKLAEARSLSTEQQHSVLTEIADQLVDLPSIRARHEKLQEACSFARSMNVLLFLLIFGFSPFLYYTSRSFDVRRLAIWLLVFLLYWAISIVAFRRAHRQLYPDQAADRRKRTWMLCFSPAAAMRTADALARPAFGEWHPIAVAAVVCPPPELAEFAIPRIRELRYPDRSPDDEPATASPLMERLAALLLPRLETVLREAGLTDEDLQAAPARDAGAVVYCPRCHRQYTVEKPYCDDCPALAPVPFERPPAATAV